jgi:hypothetical protein
MTSMKLAFSQLPLSVCVSPSFEEERFIESRQKCWGPSCSALSLKNFIFNFSFIGNEKSQDFVQNMFLTKVNMQKYHH